MPETVPATAIEVDVRGEVCPVPLMRATDAMKKAQGEAAIQVLLDHAEALDTIPHQAARLGWDVQVEETSPLEWRMTLTRKG